MLGSVAFVAFLMAMHSTQFALQPVITREFLSAEADKGALVLICEAFKVLLTVTIWTVSGTWGSALAGWNFRSSLLTAGVPAMIYSTQNLLIQTAYQNLDGVSFNVVNQTKFVFTAVFLFMLYGKRQSRLQVLALGMIFSAAVLLTLGKQGAASNSEPGVGGDGGESAPPNSLLFGYLPCALAAMLSGVASAYSENIFRTHKKNALMYSVELAGFSVLVLVVGGFTRSQFQGEPFTMVSATLAAAKADWKHLAPPFVNAAGGLVVGLLMKYAGAIYKGFATMGSSRAALHIASFFRHTVAGGDADRCQRQGVYRLILCM